MYTKVIKYIEWVLLALSVALILWGVVGKDGLVKNNALPIDLILFWSYALCAVAVLAIIVIGIYTTAKNGAKGIIKLGAVIVGAVVIIGGAFLLAPASPLVTNSVADPTFQDLKLTDTVLNLTYLFCGAAVLTILFSAIFTKVRK